MDNISSLSTGTLVTAVILTGVGFAIFSLAKRYHRLRHIPGPHLAALTDFWAAIKIWRGEYYHDFICDLHAQYGPVVRWGPNRVSFSEPQAIPEIYGVGHAFSKASSYQPMTLLANGEPIASIVTIRDEKRITDYKRHISAGFSQSTWLKQEDQINGTINLLIERLRGMAGQPISLNTWLSYWSFDTLTQLAFSESRGYLKHGDDIDNIFSSGHDRFNHWRLWSALPSWEVVIFKNRIAQRLQKTTSALAALAVRHIQDKKAADNLSATSSDLLGRYLAASQQAPSLITPKDVVSLTISTIHAGSETTATASSLALINLLSHPTTLARLEDEVATAGLAYPAPFNEADKLPYLDAVISETLRLSINPNCTERNTSSTTVIVRGTEIPPHTDVSIAEVRTARNAEVFGPDPDLFKPERWLNVEENLRREMERAAFGFSYGRRACVGQHLARIEMKKVIATLLQSFKIHLVEAPEQRFKGATNVMKLNVRLEMRA